MEFKHSSRLNDADPQKLEDIYEKLSTMSRQLSFLQGFMESKFGAEFADFCQLPDPDRPPTPGAGLPHGGYSSGRHMSEDPEEYDKMPNLVSQESPSRTLGFVSVPLRQTSTGVPSHSSRMHSTHTQDGPSKRDRSGVIKGESGLPNTVDLMYPLHNFTDLLVGNTGDAEGAAATPEFMEMELDPSQLLRGEPPALQPIYADNNGHSSLQGVSNSSGNQPHHHGHSSKRGLHRQSSISYKYEVEADNTSSDSSSIRGSNTGGRRASVGGHENNHSNKKFDCLMCGIQFDYAETLKSHMDSHSHGGARNMRSNSEDQSGINEENGLPLPRLMPRPLTSSSSELELPDPAIVKHSKSKKNQSSQQSSSSSSSSSSKATASKKRKRYNQSRPCSLECPECGLKIRDKSRLIEHLRGHSGERPFQCSYCDKSYTRKDVLKTHMIKMHGEAPQDQDSLGNNPSLEIYKSCE